MIKALKSHKRNDAGITVTGGLIGAGIIIVSSILFVALASELQRHGFTGLAAHVKAMALSVSVLVALPFSFLKGQPWRAQVAIVGGTIRGACGNHARVSAELSRKRRRHATGRSSELGSK